MTWRHYANAALGVGLVTGVVTIAGAGNAVAQGALKPLQALIVNTSANPVPVSVVGSQHVTPPLWQGTPFSTFDSLFNDTTFNECKESFAAPAGEAVLLGTVSGVLGLFPGAVGNADIRITNLDGSTTRIEVPMQRTANFRQGGQTYEAYSGSLDLGGYPVTGAQICGNSPGPVIVRMSFVGFTITLP